MNASVNVPGLVHQRGGEGIGIALHSRAAGEIYYRVSAVPAATEVLKANLREF